ncbi:MAG: PilZ domain-containing protein [Terracidiphilus sp.]|nr:PilZ domain-containing protein [Terracidiphilus sp.]MDR3797092.1 PilZ domain-containing protein [Terracidiphilus sp.]
MDGKEHGDCFTVQGQENRAHPRFSVDEDSVLLLVAHGMPVKARVVDLSLEGCRVRTLDQIKVSVRRPIEITFKANGVAFRFSGVVQWSDGHTQLGIHFVNTIPRRKLELAEVIEEMAVAAEARAKAVNQLVAEQAAREPALPEIPDVVEARLVGPVIARALEPEIVARVNETQIVADASELQFVMKTSVPPALPAETEIPAEIEPLVRRPATRRDRRGQIRHEVNTFASIFLINARSALRGQILDVSLSGCRIRTEERFPVGIYTRVEIEFHFQGLPFRLGGVTQAIHNRNTVGIRFLDLSERKRQQVLDLIGELERMRAALLNAEAASTEK